MFQRLSLVFLLGVLTGCASMFHPGPRELEIEGAPELRVTNRSGQSLQLRTEGIRHYVEPIDGTEDELTLTIDDSSFVVHPAKTMSGWLALDILSYGLGFVIDDASHSWYNYEPIHIRQQSPGGLTVINTNWLGEQAGAREISALVNGSIGLSSHYDAPPDISILAPIFLLGFHLDGGFGVDIDKKYELFYRFADEEGYPIYSNSFAVSGSVTHQEAVGRYFFARNVYLEASFGSGVGQEDSSFMLRDSTYSSVTRYTRSFPVVGAAVGWAGDISTISLSFARGLQPFDPDKLRYFQLISFNFGLNFRI